MRCLYCNVIPNGPSGNDFIVGQLPLHRYGHCKAGRSAQTPTTESACTESSTDGECEYGEGGSIVCAVGFGGEGFKCAMVVGELACQEALCKPELAADQPLVPSVGGKAEAVGPLLSEMRQRFDPARPGII